MHATFDVSSCLLETYDSFMALIFSPVFGAKKGACDFNSVEKSKLLLAISLIQSWKTHHFLGPVLLSS
jgi:hypothetical protein